LVVQAAADDLRVALPLPGVDGFPVALRARRSGNKG
jgi:hypothetical protein